ncbi:MAG: hypothetical protein EOP49_45820 [Sphingobacteriales bacterium]|nr:MAG: hypothetical protein EOP49_45820 [Sphingobacteriales bacterium]
MLAFSELPQLLKIPVFIEHFQEHQQRDPGTTVWGFIAEHYQGKFVVDDDYQRDMQLPFRTTNVVLNTTVIIAPPVPIEIPVTLHSSETEFTHSNDSRIPFTNIRDIFQPPRISS